MNNLQTILKSLMVKHGDDAYTLQEKSGVPQPTTQRFLSGRHGEPRSSTVRKWAEAYGLNESQLRGDVPIGADLIIGDSVLQIKPGNARREVDLDNSDDFVTIKRVDLKLSAGITGYSIDYLDGDLAPIVFRKDWVTLKGYDIKSLFALKVSGQSMETSLYDDDLVVINSADTRLIDGEVYAVNYEGELVIKRMIRQADTWVLSSDNHDKRKYADKLCHENCIVIGRVIYKQSERI